MSESFKSLSALLPVKNGQVFLNYLIPRILSMLTEHDNLIVVNDGSSDASGEIIESFSRIDSRVKIINTSGVGLVKSLNLGVGASDKHWIARFDVDDAYSMDRLVCQRELMKENVSVIFSDYKFASTNGLYMGCVYSAIFPQASGLSLITSQRSAHPVAVINREKLLICGGYQEADYPVEDLALWLRMTKVGKIISSPSVLLSYRLSSSSISSRNRNIQKAKTSQIIRNFDMWGTWQQEALSNLEESVSLYQKLPNSSQRIFLHIRDLTKAQRLSGIKISKRELFTRIGFKLLPKLLIVGVVLSGSALIRKCYRLISRLF
jgi:glycosyltransferase involved in cell wall biosynthesis